MDNNNPHLLTKYIRTCLETSLENSFERWEAPTVLESIHKLCSMQNLEPNSDLNKLNSIGKLFGGFKGSHKLVLENILRMRRFAYPTSQIGLYFNEKDVPSMQWIFSSPFNVPRLDFHKAPEDQILVQPPFGERRGFKLNFEHIGQDMKILLNDSGFEVENFNQSSPLKYPMDYASNNLPIAPPNTTINFHGFELGIVNRRIVNITTGEFVDVFLGNVKHQTPNIKKAIFYLAPNNEVQVAVLFTEFYMAGGIIRIKTGTENRKFICELAEIPSSYGTSDFVCGPSLKTMIRVSYFPRLKPAPAIETNELRRRLKECQDQINDLVKEVETKLEINGRKEKIRHNPDRRFVRHICLGLRSITLLYENLNGLENIVTPSGRHLESFTVREKVHYAFYLCRKHCIGLPSVCDRDGECVMVHRFLTVCKVAMGNETIPGEIRLEFGYLLIFGLLGLSEHLNGELTERIENQETFLELCLNIPDFYRSHAIYTLSGLKMVGFPKVLRPILLEMLIPTATVAEYKYFIDIYKVQGKREVIELNQDFLKTLKKYPHILLFGIDGVTVAKELFKQMGDFLDTFFANADNIILLDDD